MKAFKDMSVNKLEKLLQSNYICEKDKEKIKKLLPKLYAEIDETADRWVNCWETKLLNLKSLGMAELLKKENPCVILQKIGRKSEIRFNTEEYSLGHCLGCLNDVVLKILNSVTFKARIINPKVISFNKMLMAISNLSYQESMKNEPKHAKTNRRI